MVRSHRGLAFIRLIVAATTLFMVVGFSAPVSADGNSSWYGQHDNFGTFAGPGFTVHHGSNGESDVNVCAHDTFGGVASCDARVVTQPAANALSSSGPTADLTSACPTSDPNAPGAVVSGGNGGYDPCYLQSAYNLASLAEASGGSGQIVAIDDYSVDSNISSDLAIYRSQFGLPACPTGTVSHANVGCVFEQVIQSGAPTSGSSGWDVEISLDVDTVSAICPKCQILLVEASSAYFSALGGGVNTAVADGANAVSNSYGGSESSGENSTATSYYQHPGVAIVASSGDASGVVEFPASAPDVTAVGGTSLLQYSDKGTRSANATEKVWNGTPSPGDGAGAGCSAYEAVPTWQSTFLTNAGAPADCLKRVVADVSADADPDTGLWVYDTYSEGGWLIVGGTSLASPTIAAIYGLAGNATGSSGYPVMTAYTNSSTLYHVTSGNVGTCGDYLCDATKAVDGYSGPAGLGTPGGTGALAAFSYDPASAPGQPAPPTVTATTSTSVTLSWSAVSGATTYSVLDGTSPSPLTVALIGVGATSATVPNLIPSQTYYFAITATNSAGTSPASAAVSATTAATSTTTTSTTTTTVASTTTTTVASSTTTTVAPTTTTTVAPTTTTTVAPTTTTTVGAPPGPPTLTSARAGSRSVTLTWSAPSGSVTGYNVYVGTTSGGESTTPVNTSLITGTSVTVTGLPRGRTYYFEVRAVNAAGTSAPSNQLSAT